MTQDAAGMPQVRLITISAAYGAGGSVVAPALADRLGVPFMQRATTSDGGVTGTEYLAPEEERNMPVHRLLAAFTHTMPVGPTQSGPPASFHDESLRRDGEEGIRQLAATGSGVILGRGAAVVLGRDRGFHVRLYGPAERRIVRVDELLCVVRLSSQRPWHRITGRPRQPAP